MTKEGARNDNAPSPWPSPSGGEGAGEGAARGLARLPRRACTTSCAAFDVGAYRDTPSPNPGTDLRTGAARHALYFTI